VGRILDRIRTLGLDEDTLVLFASDNGPTYDVGGYDKAFFGGTGPLRRHKGYLYEGGIRVPFIARRPGVVPAGGGNSAVVSFQDILPTLLDAAGARSSVPRGTDGMSILPLIEAPAGPAPEPRRLYMEFPAYGGQQMARFGRWKAVRQNLLDDPDAPVELYDIEDDIGETHDAAAANPKIAAELRRIMVEEHRPSKEFPFPALDRD
jgi:arylsulfatase